MTDEQIVEAAKSAEKKTEFGGLVHSKVSQGVNSAYGIGFLDGAEWTRKQMMEDNEYIRKDALLEWAEEEMMKAARSSEAYGRRNAFMDVIDKLNEM